MLNLMKASISRVTGLVDNIMDLARARLGGGISLDLNETDLVEPLQVVADEIGSAHPHRDIRLHLELPKAALIDLLRIAQLFSNFVSNAVSHGADKHPVEINGRQSEQGIEISVRNGGIPIPADNIQPPAADRGWSWPLYRTGDRQSTRRDNRCVLDNAEICFTFRMTL